MELDQLVETIMNSLNIENLKEDIRLEYKLNILDSSFLNNQIKELKMKNWKSLLHSNRMSIDNYHIQFGMCEIDMKFDLHDLGNPERFYTLTLNFSEDDPNIILFFDHSVMVLNCLQYDNIEECLFDVLNDFNNLKK